MTLKRWLRARVGILSDLAAARFGTRGRDVFSDMRKLGTPFDPRLLFDVGANIGETAAEMAQRFPLATILAFEPSRLNHAHLSKRFRGNASVQPLQLGLSSAPGRIHFIDDPADHTMARLASPEDEGAYPVEVQTIDALCAERGFDHIDYLKIDTEGHDLEVLRGAERMLRERRVAFVEVESGVSRDNDYHVPLETLKAHLEDRDYRLFGLYEQVHEWPTGMPNLRRVNAVFIPKPMPPRD
jgi:FkbM family methyltransferase